MGMPSLQWPERALARAHGCPWSDLRGASSSDLHPCGEGGQLEHELEPREKPRSLLAQPARAHTRPRQSSPAGAEGWDAQEGAQGAEPWGQRDPRSYLAEALRVCDDVSRYEVPDQHQRPAPHALQPFKSLVKSLRGSLLRHAGRAPITLVHLHRVHLRQRVGAPQVPQPRPARRDPAPRPRVSSAPAPAQGQSSSLERRGAAGAEKTHPRSEDGASVPGAGGGQRVRESPKHHVSGSIA
jgi:hypothetical protein